VLRGRCGEEVFIHAADRDLHSGFYGSAAANPNHVLGRIVADLHDANGRVAIPCFFDRVPELPEALRRQWESLGFSAEPFLGKIGLSVPADCRVEFQEHGAGKASAFDTSIPVFQKTRAALTEEWGKEAVFIGSGGSIPVTNEIRNKLGTDVVMAGFGLSDDRIHSPNEKYDLASFHKRIRSWARILAALAD